MLDPRPRWSGTAHKQNLGHICVSFVTQPRRTGFKIKGVFGIQSTRHLGNKKSFLGEASEGWDETLSPPAILSRNFRNNRGELLANRSSPRTDLNRRPADYKLVRHPSIVFSLACYCLFLFDKSPLDTTEFYTLFFLVLSCLLHN